jgi:acyl-CoA synthetase (NDP forming)/RimJ/RimL family protein N-acetyltransferase
MDRPEQDLPGTDALTMDGAIVRLRPVSADDAAALADLHRRGSAESLRLRFFGSAGAAVIDQEVLRLLRTPDAQHAAILAEQGGRAIGVASYERIPGDARQAEFALFVDQVHYGHGVGTLLLEHLAAWAHTQGIAELVGSVLPDNARMLHVATDLSGRGRSRYDAGIVEVGLSTALDAAALDASDLRDRVAERASLRPLLAPAVVAVVGAGRQPGGIGHEVLRALVEYSFTGRVYAVNPRAQSIAGVPSYPTLAAIPEQVDLAVVAVPAVAVADVIADAGAAGVRAAVILSAGFGEAGGAGPAAQRDLVRQARAHGIRLVGPNCLGILNTDPEVRLAATFAPILPSPGGLAIASQSGAVGIAALEHAARTGTGLSTFVSLGNKADISGNDLLAYWFDDPATTAVALYLESFGNPRRFARLVRALARRKPVLAVFSGRSVAGKRAGASHAAAAASPGVAVDTLFDQAGVIRADNLGELLDTARLVTDQPLPAGDRLAIIGNAGGVNVLAADAADRAGLTVPEPSDQLLKSLQRLVSGAGNPLDLGAAASPPAIADALELIADSAEVDAVIVVVAVTRANDVNAILDALAPAVDRHHELPVALVVIGDASRHAVGQRRAPVFDLPERAVAALGRVHRYSAWRREPLGARARLSDVDTDGAREAIRATLAGASGWQGQDRIAEILGHYGIPAVRTVTASGEDAVVAEAERLGYPVVVKAGDPDLVHKSDVGAVKTGLDDATAVRAAYQQIATALGAATPLVLIQPMATGTVELVAGIVHDQLFGSLVMVGLGGVYTDLFGDRAFRLVPMTDRDAGRMWRSLRAAPLLTGYRGVPAVNTAAVEDLLLRLGRLAEELPEVAELDLNPILVGPHGAIAIDAKLRLAAIGPEPDAALRQLGHRT